MVLEERQEKIISLLLEQQSATVGELSDRFEVSSVTIRSDLNQLAEEGRIVRTHGGARLSDGRGAQEIAFSKRKKTNARQKQRIGRLAASLVQSGESILLDASSTAVAVGAALKQRRDLNNVTVITTGLWTAAEMLGTVHLDVLLTGGHVRSATGTLAGMIAMDMVRLFRVQKAFLGAGGISVEDGLMDGPLADLELKRVIVPRCQEVIAVVDSSKFGRVALASFASTDEISRLITDAGAPVDMLAAFRQRGVEILTAASPPTFA